jgi:hypothetical protein
VNLVSSLSHTAYLAHQALYSAWARRRYEIDFQRVARFCLFVGYPRSGHSLVGALLNAHRNVVIAHELDAPQLVLAGCTKEELFSRIVARAYWFNLRRNTSNHDYQVPNQWQGRFGALQVIGDKRGGAVTRCLAEHPDVLARLRALVGIPLRVVHVVRNPFDNIAAISIWHGLSMPDSADYYFAHCATTVRLADFCEPAELLAVGHEAMIDDPAAALRRLCAFLELETYPGYVEDCCSVMFEMPTYTRRKVEWPDGLIASVERRARNYPFLDGYGFEVPGDATAQAARGWR